MDRQDSIGLSRRLLERVRSNSSDEAPEMMVEPASAYLDPERWARERQLFFLETPQVIGFAGEVADPGTYMTAEVMGVPVVVTRDESGRLGAFVNACAHRGAPVARGHGERKRLTCAYHGWSYHLDGSLAGRPEEAAFDPPSPELGLRPLPVSDRYGLIVVGLEGVSQQSVDAHLESIGPALQGLGLERAQAVETRRFEVAANWKLVVGLSHESYHFSPLHRESLVPLMSSHAVHDFYDGHSRWAFPLRDIEDALGGAEANWPDRLPGAVNYTLFPGTVMVVPQVDAQLIRAEPGAGPGESIVYYSGACTDPGRREESHAAYDFGGAIFEGEDLMAAIQCQRGLESGQTSVIFGRNEPVVQFWHRLWRQRLEQGA